MTSLKDSLFLQENDLPPHGGKAELILETMRARLVKIDFGRFVREEEIFIRRIPLVPKISVTGLSISSEGNIFFFFQGREIQGNVSVYGSCPKGHERMKSAVIERIITEFANVLRETYPDLWGA